ncbi:MAG: DUF5688 family protein [Lachnospiraceae bacterium]
MENTMTYEEFLGRVSEEMNAYAGAEARAVIQKVKKNNGIELNGISIFCKGRNTSPTIYLEEFYNRYRGGESFEKIREALIDCYESHLCDQNLDVSFYREYAKVRKRLSYKLINREKNKELLKEVPYKEYLNLAVVFFCAVDHEMIGSGMILVRESHLEMWHVDVETVYADAMENTPKNYPVRVYPMSELLKEYPEEIELWEETAEGETKRAERGCMKHMDAIPMYVLTNDQKIFGAGVMLYKNVLKKVAERMKNNLAILPSSIHELIAVPVKGEAEAAAYESMVREINATQVACEDVLSDRVYYFERKSGRLVVAERIGREQAG